ncbi:MAG: type II toxin-antitoxin system PemK/MazF family toxin [Bacteroidota bacterium]
MTSKLKPENLLRIRLLKDECGNEVASDILADQIRAIDNNRLIEQKGSLNTVKLLELEKKLKALLGI